MKKVKYLLLLLPVILLPGCMGGGGMDVNQMLKNPVIQVIIGIIVLYMVFKHSGKH